LSKKEARYFGQKTNLPLLTLLRGATTPPFFSRMYYSRHPISNQTKQQLKARIEEYISRHPVRRCKALKRNVQLSKYIAATNTRADAVLRYRSFFCAMQIIAKASDCKEKMINGFKCFEIQGRAQGGEVVTIHMREEVHDKDKILYLISTFYK
jgi:hypothetical protein